MTHDEMIEVITAHKEGKQIEYSYRAGTGSKRWQAISSPATLWAFDEIVYRVKAIPRVRWIVEGTTATGNSFIWCYTTEAEASRNLADITGAEFGHNYKPGAVLYRVEEKSG